VKGYCVKDWVEWRPEDKNRFYVIEKATGKVVKNEYMTAEAFFYMHVINCYEVSDGDDEQIVIDINTYESPSVMETLAIPKLRKSVFEDCDQPSAQRFVIPLVGKTSPALNTIKEDENLVKVQGTTSTAIRKGNQIVLTPETLTDIKGAELQTLNPKCFAKKYKYFYTAGTYNPSHFSHSICKVNVETKEMILWKPDEFIYPGEPYFIPKPDGTDEDDGVIISSVADMRKEIKDYLVVLDAKTLTEIGRATFENTALPCSLHGTFIPGIH
jgi:carotenoid cleavage dioxygenase-like enzyme